jgi:hypothetical protein
METMLQRCWFLARDARRMVALATLLICLLALFAQAVHLHPFLSAADSHCPHCAVAYAPVSVSTVATVSCVLVAFGAVPLPLVKAAERVSGSNLLVRPPPAALRFYA